MLSSAVVLAVGIPAVWIDTRTHRIPNALVAATLLGACAAELGMRSMAGLGAAIGGASVGLLILLPFYLSGAMGAGDVKFMAALGALVGPGTAVLAAALTLVAGSALALATVGRRRWSQAADRPAATGTSVRRIPYAGAIVTGTLVATLIAS